MKNIAKPITIAREEFANNLVNTINTSRLPLFVVEYILKDVLGEVHRVSMKQLQEDKTKYEAEIKAVQQTDETQNEVETGE